ncbi:MAG: low molecular weight protein-tyrosine-phosphatase [Nocardioides sp.]
MSNAELPPPRRGGEYAVALVCLGNICRSPMADVVLTAHVDRAGLSGRVTVDSCGTGDWHIGQPMDRRAAATLTAAGFDPTLHRARVFDPAWLERHDLVLAMDEHNLADIRASATAVHDGRVLLFRDFDPIGTGGEVPDPYYGGDAGFEEVLDMVDRTSAALVSALQQELS